MTQETTDPEIDVEMALDDVLSAHDVLGCDVTKEGGLGEALEAAREYVTALEALEAERAKLDAHIDAGGSATWLCDDGNAEVECTGTASEAAREYVDGDDWGDDGGVVHVYCRAKFLPDRAPESETVTLEVEEPECTADDAAESI